MDEDDDLSPTLYRAPRHTEMGYFMQNKKPTSFDGYTHGRAPVNFAG